MKFTMNKIEAEKADDFLPQVRGVVITEKLINVNIAWLVLAIS